jgi:hypothetical protein
MQQSSRPFILSSASSPALRVAVLARDRDGDTALGLLAPARPRRPPDGTHKFACSPTYWMLGGERGVLGLLPGNADDLLKKCNAQEGKGDRYPDFLQRLTVPWFLQIPAVPLHSLHREDLSIPPPCLQRADPGVAPPFVCILRSSTAPSSLNRR